MKLKETIEILAIAYLAGCAGNMPKNSVTAWKTNTPIPNTLYHVQGKPMKDLDRSIKHARRLARFYSILNLEELSKIDTNHDGIIQYEEHLKFIDN